MEDKQEAAIPETLATDSSSLVDLRAEVFRKQQEAKFNRLHGNKSNQAAGSKSNSKNAIWSRENAGLTAREKRDQAEAVAEQQRVRNALEVKAKLYDKLHKGQLEDKEGRFLVDFREDDESDDATPDFDDSGPVPEGEEWVEYVDALGRSRMAMKKDINELKERDRDLEGSVRQVGGAQESDTKDEEPSLLSEDMRRELLRKKWEQEEEENLKKTKVHYKDLLFDEARTHGAAFYNFSRDETKRSEEMENLEAMHKETDKVRAQKDHIKNKRKVALEARLKKVRDRKRLKMGLPIQEEDISNIQVDTTAEVEVDEAKKMDYLVMAGIREMRALQEKQKQDEDELRRARKAAGPREWDRGKEGVDEITAQLGRSRESRVFSQCEWIDKQRKERSNEFAPPTSYENRPSSSRGPKPSSSYRSVPPPADQPPKGAAGPPPPVRHPVSKPSDSNLSTQSRLDLHREMKQSWDSVPNRRLGAEVPPPCQMDYYSNSKSTSSKFAPITKSAMSESFAAGLSNQLKHFRNNAKHESSSESDDND